MLRDLFFRAFGMCEMFRYVVKVAGEITGEKPAAGTMHMADAVRRGS
jgi:hypothetical protein